MGNGSKELILLVVAGWGVAVELGGIEFIL